ncbi:CcdB family protein [Rhodobacteraceae bacterium DSL-40]|uniref:CcdB family protein n=1 Tax=Amaricoccus sp. B4 TaxID=3368557 RepID=UPI0013A6DE28
MAQQFDVFRMSDGMLVVVIQNDLLDAVRTRVVAPLLPVGRAGPPMRGLNPEFQMGAERVVLMPQLLATLALPELGERVGSLAPMRDDIVRALDILLAGV